MNHPLTAVGGILGVFVESSNADGICPARI